MRNGLDRCCRTCRTWSEWWYWFCRRTGPPKTPACISLKPISEPSFSFRSPIYLYYCYSTTTPSFFRISGFKIGDLVSYRLVSPCWAELSFYIGKFECVVLCVKWLCMVSSLSCEFAITTMLSLFRTFLFGFYNFIRGTPLLAIVILFGFSWKCGLINAWI